MSTNKGLGDTAEEMQRVFEAVREHLQAKDSDWVRENLEANEWGLALEHLIFLVEFKKLFVHDGTRQTMYALAERMNFDLPRLRKAWKKL